MGARLACLLVIAAACKNDGETPPLPDCGIVCEPDLLPRDGGKVELESIHFDTELQTAMVLPPGETSITRVTAYFMSARRPENVPLPVPNVCNNLVATRQWPTFVGDDHVDLDVGAVTITGPDAAGTNATVDVPRQSAGIDSVGRAHDIFYQRVVPGRTNQRPGSAYTFQWGGDAAIPPATFGDAIFVPDDFTVIAPGLEDDGPLLAGVDFPVGWTTETTTPPPDGAVLIAMVWLLDSNGTPTHLCPTLFSEGTFTIPGSTIAEYKDIVGARGQPTDTLILVRSAVVPQLERLPNLDDNNHREIDALGAVSFAQRMNVQ